MGQREERSASQIVDGVRRRPRRDTVVGKSSLRAKSTTCDALDAVGTSTRALSPSSSPSVHVARVHGSRPIASNRREMGRFERNPFGFEPVSFRFRSGRERRSTIPSGPIDSQWLALCDMHLGRVCASGKQNLPQKICVTCGRPFTWRKKWERCWDEVSTCSKRCNAERKRQNREEARKIGGSQPTTDSDDQ